MNSEDAREYTDTISLVAEGAYRQVALGIKWGIPKALGISREEWVSRIGSIKLSVEDRREAVKELSKDHSNREIADILGVGEATIRRDASNGAPKTNNTNENEYKEYEYASNGAPADEEDDDDGVPPENLVEAFVTRASNTIREAENCRSIIMRQPLRMTAEIVSAARAAADAWNTLARSLEAKHDEQK